MCWWITAALVVAILYILDKPKEEREEKPRPMPQINFGRLTREETQKAMRDAMANLTEEDVFEILNAELTDTQKAELSLQWEEIQG